MYIPNSAVGAIIGTKGSNIRNMIRFSGASVKIAPIDTDKGESPQAERKVTIVGSPESQWKVSKWMLLFAEKFLIVSIFVQLNLDFFLNNCLNNKM